ncbi:MAG: LysR family transcriptional regulator [Xanthobacteraceae bacterium]|nr:LysR family transcriptional regulator [Xanthobacteraceae bacterium]
MDRFTTFQLFVRVVETGSFSKAAGDLGLTQPTVTKHVSAIERQLGVRLLNRNSRGISLTEIGALYFERCKIVLRELEATENIVGQRQGEIIGTLRIGTSMTFGRQVIAPMLIGFLDLHPALKVDLICDDRYVDVVGQGLDMALRLGKLADSALGCRYLGNNPWVMVAADTYLSRHGQPDRPEDLAAHQCLVYSTVQGDDVWHVCTPQGEHVSVHVSGKLKSNNLSILLTAVRAGLGVAIMPNYAAAAAIRADEVKRIMTDHVLPQQEINAVFPSPQFVPSKVSVFASYLQRRFAGEWWQQALP